jgi:valyl-tRNA synthetase
MKVGRRLAIKLLNASKFVLATAEPRGPVTELLDRGILTNLSRLVADVTEHLEGYDYARALEATESFFWAFCDDHLELVKSRRYGAQGPEALASANTALQTTLSILLRLFAPYLPFATDEVWSWWKDGSIHRASWPTPAEALAPLDGREDADAALAHKHATEVLGEVRRGRSALVNLPKARATVVKVAAPAEKAKLLRAVENDLKSAGAIDTLDLDEQHQGETVITFDETPPPPAPAAGEGARP